MQINKELSIIMDFAEGRTTAEEFWEHFKSNKDLRNVIIEDPKRPDLSRDFYDPAKIVERKINPKSCRDSSAIYSMVEDFLEGNGLSYITYDFYKERYRFMLDIQPNWLDMDVQAETFLFNEVMSQAPQNLTKPKKIKWCKDKIKEYFRYESRPPRWVQSAEWPMNENGKPLVFRRQSKEDIHCELVKFYFYDPDSDKEIVVEQLY